MGVHIFRVMVRGRFANLDDDTRSALLDDAAAHDVLSAAFTREGTLTYDPALVAFTYRYEVRESGDGSAETAGERAVEMASSSLAAAGIGHGGLEPVVIDMADVWRGRDRGR